MAKTKNADEHVPDEWKRVDYRPTTKSERKKQKEREALGKLFKSLRPHAWINATLFGARCESHSGVVTNFSRETLKKLARRRYPWLLNRRDIERNTEKLAKPLQMLWGRIPPTILVIPLTSAPPLTAVLIGQKSPPPIEKMAQFVTLCARRFSAFGGDFANQKESLRNWDLHPEPTIVADFATGDYYLNPAAISVLGQPGSGELESLLKTRAYEQLREGSARLKDNEQRNLDLILKNQGGNKVGMQAKVSRQGNTLIMIMTEDPGVLARNDHDSGLFDAINKRKQGAARDDDDAAKDDGDLRPSDSGNLQDEDRGFGSVPPEDAEDAEDKDFSHDTGAAPPTDPNVDDLPKGDTSDEDAVPDHDDRPTRSPEPSDPAPQTSNRHAKSSQKPERKNSGRTRQPSRSMTRPSGESDRRPSASQDRPAEPRPPRLTNKSSRSLPRPGSEQSELGARPTRQALLWLCCAELDPIPLGTAETFNIGRHERNDLILRDGQVSRYHACFRLQGRSLILEDLGSSNGVYVNDRLCARQAVKPDDSIQIGPYAFDLRTLEDEASPAPETSGSNYSDTLAQSAGRLTGDLSDLSFAQLLRKIEFQRLTGEITITTAIFGAHVRVRAGVIHSAFIGEKLEGEEALAFLLPLTQGQFHFNANDSARGAGLDLNITDYLAGFAGYEDA